MSLSFTPVNPQEYFNVYNGIRQFIIVKVKRYNKTPFSISPRLILALCIVYISKVYSQILSHIPRVQ